MLVVEDEALVAMMIGEELSAAGAEIIGPESDLEGALHRVRTAAQGWIDAAVVDVNLHGVHSGPIVAVLTERRIPFVIATGYGMVDLKGVPSAPVMRKPFDCLRLIEVLRDLTDPATEEREGPLHA